MKVLVAGGAGFIGSHACKALMQAGHHPIVYDNLTTGHAHAVRWGPLEVGDIRDSARLSEVLGRRRPDLVMHFAARAYVGESVREPADYYDVNVTGTLTLLQCMKRASVDKIVFSSSCATYGVPRSLPIDDDAPQNPINPYGFTKLVGERMLAEFEAAYGLKWMALRYFNAAGADPDGELGEEHAPETHAIPLAIQAALGIGPSFTLFGDDYDTPDGSAVRDYVHVSDLADAHVRAAEYLLAGGRSAACNLATGAGTSVLEIVSAVKAATGRTVPLAHGPRRPGDPPALFASGAGARDLLGWRPRFPSIEETVATAARWFQRHDAHNIGTRQLNFEGRKS
jgi:UDP-arabinose 4-epimerase